MSCCFYRILTFFLFLHFPGSLVAVYAPSTLARRLLLNDSSYSSPPTTDASSFPNHKPISDDSASADFCDHDCNAHSLPHSRTLTISVVSIFIACVVMAFVSVFARRFCAPDANLHVDYYGIERNNETCKLNEALMRSLPMVNYGKADESELKMMMNAECAVCLCEFEEGEVLRLLPACSHLFHKDCVDMWLFSHTTCPLCRLSLLRQKRDTDDVSQEHPAGASDQRRQDSTSVAAAEV